MNERDEKIETDEAVEKLIMKIRCEPVPKRMLELVRALQAALDERHANPK